MTKMTKWKIILPGSEIDLSGANQFHSGDNLSLTQMKSD